MDLAILVDMDGVIVNTMEGFGKELKRQVPNIPLIPIEEIREFYLEKQYPKEYASAINNVWATPGFFYSLKSFPGSKEALNELTKYADVAICTSPVTESPTCAQEKWQWVDENLGREWVKRLIITKDKTRVAGNILIDDKPEVTGVRLPTWEHVVYTQPWNRQVTDKRRLTWENWKEVLSELRYS